MYSAILDNVLQADGDIKDIRGSFSASVVREDGFVNSEQILREKSESTLEFKGGTYTQICSKRRSNPCPQMPFKVVNECNKTLTTVFEGLVSQNNITLEPAHCKGKINAIKDNSFSGLIRDYMDTEVALYGSRTKNCESLLTIDRTIKMFKDPDDLNNTFDAKCFDGFDILNYLVKYFTNNVIEVRSDYLTDNRIAITTGFNLHNSTGSKNQIYPKLTIQQVFNEIRKKKRLYMVIEYDGLVPYLRVETEDYSYDSTAVLMTINNLPLTLEERMDYSRYFNAVKVGSTVTELQEDAIPVYPQNELTAWQNESYNSCSDCIADKDSEGVILDLVSEYIIDSNVIFEALNAGVDYAHDDEIFMFEYEIDSEGLSVATLTTTGGTKIYNYGLINETVINNWLGYTPLCISLSNSTTNYFLANKASSFIGTGSDPTSTISRGLVFDNEIIDNANNYTPSFSGGGSPSFGNTISIFTAPTTGNYRFNIKQGIYISALDCLNIADSSLYKIILRVYDAAGVLLNSYDSPIISKENNTEILRMEFDTPIIPMNVTDQAVPSIEIVLSYNCGSPGATLTLLDGYFSLTGDDAECDTLSNTQDAKPFIIDFEYPLCLEDFMRIKANKRGVIRVKGLDFYIKEVKFYPTGIGRFTLMGSNSICGAC